LRKDANFSAEALTRMIIPIPLLRFTHCFRPSFISSQNPARSSLTGLEDNGTPEMGVADLETDFRP